MSKKKDNFEDKKPRNCTMIMIWVIMVIISGAVLCCVAGFFFNIFEYQNADNIVITFLGALAAFAVISNYALMVEIRKETEKGLDEMRNTLNAYKDKLEQLDGYYEDTIVNHIADVLNKKKVGFPFSIKPNSIISIKHKSEKIYHTEVRMVMRRGNQIITGEHEVKYYEVDLGNETCNPISKASFDN